MQHIKSTAPHTVVVRSIIAVTSFLCSLYMECFHQTVHATRYGETRLSWFVDGSFLRIVISWSIIGLVLWLFIDHGTALRRVLHQYRWIIGAVFIIVLTALRISGSSIAQWASTLGSEAFQGTLWGIPRGIRSDEWAVFTPFAFSQKNTDYSAVSDIIRAWPTNVTMLYAQPAWALATLFRPFLWGFLILGNECGLAFFWSARLAVLCLVSYEFGRMITQDNRWLSAGYAVMIAFSPILQWWFAVNGIAELFIFGQSLVLLLGRYLNASRHVSRCLIVTAIIYCAVGYALVLYPAWQIPLFFVFSATGVAKALEQSEWRQHTWPVIWPLIMAAISTILIIGLVFWPARDTVAEVLSTAYPGARKETGGGMGHVLFNYALSPLAALDDSLAVPNAPEQATFYSMFPLGIILSALSLRKRKDLILIALLAVDAILLVFGLFGFPRWLASATLLSNVTVDRVKLATTFIDVVLVVRVLGSRKFNVTGDRWMSPGIMVGSVVFSSFAVLVGARLSTQHYGHTLVVLMVLFGAAIFASAAYTLMNWRQGSRCIAIASVLVLVSGMCVNPIQHGAKALTDNPVATMVTTALHDVYTGSGNVALITDDPFIGQAMVGNGIPTITSVNSVPALARWRAIDKSGRYQDIYNRYAYVRIDLQGGNQRARFTLWEGHPDYIDVRLSVKDLPAIGATHILTSKDVSQYQTSSISFVPIGRANGLTLYEISTTSQSATQSRPMK